MDNNKRPLFIPFAGPAILESPLLNKGTAFSDEERSAFNLNGLLPQTIETIEEQVERAYAQYSSCETNLKKYIYLRNIQDTNETLFYKLVENHISEIMPIIYTPTVGAACEKFSNNYRRSRGVFISYPNRDKIDAILNNANRTKVKVIVVTDGERILGLGDLGIGGMGIPIGKLSLYTSCGGISPAYTLPVMLDVGTNNPNLLNDPLYMGWRHNRIEGDEYNAFIQDFIEAATRRWPNVIIQFEDFAIKNAMPVLNTYKDKICCFNDDIQGTAAVTVGTLLAACKAKNVQLKDQRITFLGAGSAGCGIAEAIIAQMVKEGISDEVARSQVYMVDRWGLLQTGMPNLLPFQQKLTHPATNIQNWQNCDQNISLKDVVANAKPSILIGVSGAPGMFTQDIIQTMMQHHEVPIIMPLSNPTSRIEATPENIIQWTQGKAIVATGSPFDPVTYNEKSFEIPQCNNSYIFPGIGLGAVTCSAKRITMNMLMASSEALADCSPLAKNGIGSLLPPLEEIQQVSKIIAKAVAIQAIADGVAHEMTEEQIDQAIEANFWQPEYRSYIRSAF
jgi:malate dehydrogenase (oxaloacetate-decarboxylating)